MRTIGRLILTAVFVVLTLFLVAAAAYVPGFSTSIPACAGIF